MIVEKLIIQLPAIIAAHDYRILKAKAVAEGVVTNQKRNKRVVVVPP